MRAPHPRPMYPFLRMAAELWRIRRLPRLGPTETHVSHHRVWPWDLDPWAELNNGRTLTLFDLGRLPILFRVGLDRVLRANRWFMTVAGSTVRYRRRVTVFQRLRLATRVIGWDARFVYIEQAFWRGDDCTTHMLIRMAVVGPAGIVPPAQAIAQLGAPADSPPLPAWAEAWVAAEAARPWPPACR